MKTFLLFLMFLSTAGFAQDPEVLPAGFPVTRYSGIWENSPFNREVVARVRTQQVSDFGNSYSLEGLVSDQKVGFIAYLRDLKDDSFLMVTKKKSPSSSLFLSSFFSFSFFFSLFSTI